MTIFIVGMIGMLLGAIAATITIGIYLLATISAILSIEETEESLKEKLDLIRSVENESERIKHMVSFIYIKILTIIDLKKQEKK